MKKPIYKFSLGYTILRPVVEFATRCHYNHLVIRGRKNLPKEGGYIFAPCHQNAMMDPLIMLCCTPKPIVFLCRSDIFAKPVANAILTFLKILPVYRIRDGKENLSKNEGIFNKSKETLVHGVPLCLFAEGRHNDKHQMLPLVKGMFRIAGETQKELGDKPLYIVPTGIDYEDYLQPYHNVVVNFGKPIDVRPFLQTYEENEPVALNQMREALTQGLSAQMHNVRSKEHYEEYYGLSHILNRKRRKAAKRCNTPWNRFMTRKAITEKLDAEEVNETLVTKVGQYKAQCEKLQLNYRVPSEHWCVGKLLLNTLIAAAVVAAVICLAPVRRLVLFALLCFPISFLPVRRITKKLIKDPQFRSSINFAIKFGFSIIYVISISIICNCTHGFWLTDLLPNLGGFWWGWIAFAAAWLVAFANGPFVTWIRHMGQNWQYLWLRITKGKETKQLDQLCDELDKVA